MNRPSPLDFAEGLAREGCRVFPCRPAEKLPAIKAWQKHATDDPATIRRWAEQFPGCNWGVATERFKEGALLVLDVDRRTDKNGEQALAELVAKHGPLPETFEAASPNGRHLYFAVPTAVRQGANVFGPGLDVRSGGGFVVAPGSVIPAGRYTARNELDVAPAPAWLVDACGTRREKAKDREPLPGVDPQRARARAIEYLTTGAPEAIEGAGGDHTTFVVAAKVKDLGVTEDEAVELMLEHWHAGCGWTPDDLAVKVANAYRYGANPPGADAPEAVFEPVPEAARTARYTLHTVGDLVAQRPPSWLVRGLLPARGLGVVYGAPGSGKSFLVLDLAAAIARGIPWAGQRTKSGAVVYVGLEGRMGPRVSAYLREHDLAADDVAALHIVERQGLNLLQDERADVRHLIADIKAAGLGHVALVIVDTLNRAMPGGNENASEDMGRAIRCAGDVSAALDCLCVFVHHSGKDAGKGARGHSSLLGAADAELEVLRGGDGESRFLEATKVKDGEDGARFSFKLKVVDLGATRDHDPDAEPWERDASCVVEGLAPTTFSGSGKARKWTPARTNALAALRLAVSNGTAEAIDWDGTGTCTIEEWRNAYHGMTPLGDDLEGKELDKAKDTRRRNFGNAVDWLTAEKIVTTHEEKGRTVYRVQASD